MTPLVGSDVDVDATEVLAQALKILTPVALPYGRVVQNRLVKVRVHYPRALVWQASFQKRNVSRSYALPAGSHEPTNGVKCEPHS